MSTFVVYLIAINVISFIAFTIDFFLCSRNPGLQDTRANALLMCLFPIAGGAVGSLVALFIWNGRVHRHRISKENVAWWFLSIVCFVAWVLVTGVATGLVELDFGGLLAPWDLTALKVLGIYLAVINVVTLIMFIADKAAAERGRRYSKRAPEARLLGLCLIGGSVGGLIGMYATRHKTQKWYFVWGLPAFIVLDAAVVVYLRAGGLV